MVTYSCQRCERATEAPLEAAVRLVARNRARCQICGGPLVFPPEVTEAVRGARQVSGRDLAEETEYSCPRCDRTMTRPLGALIELVRRKKTGCQVCGTPLVFPQHVHGALDTLAATGRVQKTELTVNCPTCKRAARAQPDLPDRIMVCAYCRTPFQPPLQEGGLARLVAPEEARVEPLGAEAELPPPTSLDWGLFVLGVGVLFAPICLLLVVGQVSVKLLMVCCLMGASLMGQRRVRRAASRR